MGIRLFINISSQKTSWAKIQLCDKFQLFVRYNVTKIGDNHKDR